VIESLAEAVGYGLRSGTPLHISQIRLRLPYTDVRSSQMRRIVEDARKSGLDVTADQSPYEATVDPLPLRLPARLLSGAAVKPEYRSGTPSEPLKRAVEELLVAQKPERILIVSFPENPSFEGRTIREIAAEQKKTAAEVCLALLRRDAPPVAAFFETNDKVIRALMPFDWVFTASDAIPCFGGDAFVPPSCYGTFPRTIRKYAIEDKIIRLGDAIRSMTSAPAEKFGLRGRGRLAVGNYADIAVIDLKSFADLATYREPQKPARGVVHLLVNGIVSIEGGKVTGHRGGRAIRRF
jgi:N-acyl-D-amino-acid deacylase